ncbi:MAG: hypothetical protein AAGJ11_14450 [Bacteroidota bacterium]
MIDAVARGEAVVGGPVSMLASVALLDGSGMAVVVGAVGAFVGGLAELGLLEAGEI